MRKRNSKEIQKRLETCDSVISSLNMTPSFPGSDWGTGHSYKQIFQINVDGSRANFYRFLVAFYPKVLAFWVSVDEMYFDGTKQLYSNCFAMSQKFVFPRRRHSMFFGTENKMFVVVEECPGDVDSKFVFTVKPEKQREKEQKSIPSHLFLSVRTKEEKNEDCLARIEFSKKILIDLIP